MNETLKNCLTNKTDYGPEDKHRKIEKVILKNAALLNLSLTTEDIE